MFSTSQGLLPTASWLVRMKGVSRALSTKGALAVLDQAIVSITNFIWIREIGRACSLGQLGDYYIVMTLLFVLLNVQSELITAPYTVYCHRKSGKSLSEYTGSVFVHQLVASLVAVFAFVVFLLLTPLTAFGTSMSLSVAVLILAGPFWMMRGFLRYMSFARMHCGSAVIMDATACLIQLCGLWLLIQTNTFRLHWAFAVMGVSSAIVVIAWFLIRPIKFTMPRDARPAWRENWPFAKWALLSQLVGCMTPHMFPWLVTMIRGRVAAGILGAANTICGVAVMFSLGVSHILTPAASRAFVRGGKPALFRVLGSTAAFLMLTVGSFCGVALLFGEQAMVVIFDSRFSGHGNTLAVLSVAVLINCLSITCGNGLWAIDRPKLNLVADATVLITTIVSAIFLIRPYGPFGAACATLVGNTCGTVVRCGAFWFGLATLESKDGVCNMEAAS
ncbi:MAG TPA: lipopolysaccharide biosynthesis protein [Planctomycetes bacterium]|nr:lipopolysaccharide biosynthesis protein [Planctomycetaceae bacterium]HIM28819.1 lipopolysaccharide biosynthesis protein [Planctomycetota bacterium]